RRVVGHQLALIDDQHSTASALHLAQNVSAEDDGLLPPELLEQVANLGDLVGIQAAGGLVENEQIRVVENGRANPTRCRKPFESWPMSLLITVFKPHCSTAFLMRGPCSAAATPRTCATKRKKSRTIISS